MIKKLVLNNILVVEKIHKLQYASYKVEAEIIGFKDIPPLRETIDDIRKSDEIFYGHYIGDELAGIISYKIDLDVIDLYRVAVHPDYFKMGIAGNLLDFIEQIKSGIKKITVCTGSKNYPAVNLYIKKGYKKADEFVTNENIFISMFEKEL